MQRETWRAREQETKSQGKSVPLKESLRGRPNEVPAGLFKMTLLNICFAIPGLLIIYSIVNSCLWYLHYERLRKQLGSAPLERYPGWDRLLGLDYVYAMVKALKKHRFCEFQKETYGAYDQKAWNANFFGNRMVYTSRSDNMTAVPTSLHDSFAIEPIRVGNGAITPFTGRGASTSDGVKWQTSRDLIKPYFDRAAFTNLERLEVHVNRLLSKIPTDDSPIDMQPLFQRWVSTPMHPRIGVSRDLYTETSSAVPRYVYRVPFR